MKPVHLIAFAVMVTIFGSNFVAIRVSNKTIPHTLGAGLRFVVAAVVLFGVVSLMRIPLPRGRSLTAALLFGLFSYGGTFGCLFLALTMIPAAPAAVLCATAPLFTVLIALALRVEVLSWRKVVGAASGVAGCAWIYRNGMSLDISTTGFLLCMAAAAFAGLAAVILKRAPRSHPIGVNAVACVVGGVVLLALAYAQGMFPLARWNGPGLLALSWLALMGTVVGFSINTWLLAHWSPTNVNYHTVLSPVITGIVAAVLLSEPIRTDLIIGSIPILAGAWAGDQRPATAAAPSPSR
jgi:drug/metabolite transporter (DMT)-like permease